ncbi:hypothetical protein MON38_15850 [Hymenobacter sp. DH14]|uniref:phosphoribosylglycinamide formyltransferase 1 n=1 Tax=Hymenobacter cyanobacteriorum TaxID=2926463 RepID=A0A9X1VIJ3_9BACT|nr:formyltransferase family protein [Hymenobacter cyanobacteriorum]MCI1188897.1 hypothetical protein [Hymenobacter cyanobacteriorum]
MNKEIKSFAIYCSQGASRVLKFYADNSNLAKYSPSIVIYDGNRIDVIQQLKYLFSERLILFNYDGLTSEQKSKINSVTSLFIHEQLNAHNIDFLLCFGERILKKNLINAYFNRLINFHPSILPSFKGLAAIDQALNYNAALLGNTAHYIDEGVDTGRIIIQTAMLKEDFESYEDVLELQLPMIKIILRDLLNYLITSDEIFEDIKERRKSFIMPLHCDIK